ncbi:hypothetical protein LE181_22520 [Streptomyces sp. SCA3-4]|uniref:hypothetical protein n=1 Tax=Streptomyces sichuanensis TaxID=2871810 RepID=UPI001CE2804F|nr:hypothetical protein [Streptomyces sichuanensis]MCA6094934.1 hypothetical protein [Streptomyces sichuanensis]
MRAKVAAVVVSAALVLGLAAGCGIGRSGGAGGGTEEAGGAAEDKDEHEAVRVLGHAQLRHAELEPREVPGFLVERASASTAGHGLPSTGSRECRPLVVALGSQPQPAPVASVVNTFAKATGAQGFQGLLGTIRVSTYAGDGARSTVRALRSAAEDCAGGFAMETGEGQPQRFEAVRALPAPHLGDEAMAYRLVNAAERAPSLVTVVRTGATLSMFFATHLSDPGAVEIPQALVAAQVAKVEVLQRAERPPTAPPPHAGPGAGPGEGGEAGDGENDGDGGE